MTAEEKAEAFFLSGLNCAQSVFCAFAEDFGMDLETAKKVSCGLGGGVGRLREVCGAVTGAALVLGMRKGPDKADVYPAVQDFGARFKEACGTLICRELLAAASEKNGVAAPTSGGAAELRTPAYYKARPCVELVKQAVRLISEN